MSTSQKAKRITEALKTEWEAIGNFCADLTDEDWKVYTDCSSWTVQDNLSHMTGTELFLAGEQPPEIDLGDTSHLKNDIAKLNELWVTQRRTWPSSEVLEEFNKVTKSRLETLSNLSDEEWEAEGMTPVGMSPYIRFMQIRVLDCWMHEQDMRMALSKPGSQEGAPIEICLDEIALAMGFVVGKKAGAPDGSKVEFDLSGSAARSIKVQVTDGRAGLVDDFGEPDILFQMKAITFTRLAGGRITAKELLGKHPDAIMVESAEDFKEVAESILDNLGYMF